MDYPNILQIIQTAIQTLGANAETTFKVIGALFGSS